MYANFTNAIEPFDITSEKVNKKIAEVLKHLINSKEKSVVQYAVHEQCRILIDPYVELMQYYASTKYEENYEQVVSSFLKHYEKFTATFTRRIKNTNHKRHFCCLVVLAWLEFLETAEKEFGNKNDMLARSINMQLQTDIIHIAENELKLNAKNMNEWKKKLKKY
jgi:hypothetical protein